MKPIGIVRKLDDLGRITLPSELRATMELEQNQPMEIFATKDSIVLRKFNKCVCRCCNSTSNLITVKIADEETSICLDCYKLFGDALEIAIKAGVFNG